MAVNTDIFLGSKASLTMIPEVDLNIPIRYNKQLHIIRSTCIMDW